MPQFMTGRLPAVRPAALADLEVYSKGPLPRPPRSVKVPECAYPMDNNNVEGDCTLAGADHVMRAFSALYPEFAVPDPTDAEIKSTYRGLSGGGDTGLVEATLLKVWMTEGLFGTRIDGYAPISPTNLLALHQGIAFYNAAYLGITCPRSAQEQFATGEAWTFEGEETNDGHCIVALGYLPNGNLLCATWGGIAEVTPGFLAHYLDEAWAILGPQLVGAKKDSLGIDLAALQTDLALV